MEYVVAGICIVAAMIICAVFIYRSRKKNDKAPSSAVQSITDDKSARLLTVENEPQEMAIPMEMLPAKSIPDESKLVEITDSKILAHINNLVPGLAQVGNAANNAVQAVQANGEVLYRAIIPAGAKLTDSKTMASAVRGFYRGADGIQGHANLVATEAQKGTAAVANTAAAAMGVASMVVGQYYMTQINAELGEISDGISKIADFQDNEYRSKVFGLVAQVKTIASFQVEILQNDELRDSKISQLNSLEQECIELLGLANLTLAGYAKKEGLDYKVYEKELHEAQNWYMYQKTLLDVLYKISDLRYALHFGAVSREQCTALLPTYIKQVADVQEKLSEWHQNTAKRLSIDTSETRRKRDHLDGVIHFLPGLFNDDFNFRSISKDTASMIQVQAIGYVGTHPYDESNLYQEDVQLIVKNGKVYYLPESKAE